MLFIELDGFDVDHDIWDGARPMESNELVLEQLNGRPIMIYEMEPSLWEGSNFHFMTFDAMV